MQGLRTRTSTRVRRDLGPAAGQALRGFLTCAPVGYDYLVEAEREIEQHPVMLDWYMTLMLEWGRVNLLLVTVWQPEAAACADRFVRLAGDTTEWTLAGPGTGDLGACGWGSDW